MTAWSISRRVATGFASLLAISLVLGGLSLWRLADIGRSVAVIADNTVPSLVTVSGMIQSNVIATRAVRRAIIESADDPRAGQAGQEAFDAAVQEGERLRGTYGRLLFDERERQLFSSASSVRSELLSACRDAFEGVRRQKLDTAREVLRDRIDPLGQQCTERFNEMIDHNVTVAKAEAGVAQRKLRTGFLVIGIGLGLAMLLASLLGVAITGTTSRTLREISESLENGAVQTAAAAAELSSVSESLATGCSEQGSSVAQTSAALEQMSTMIRSTADNAARAKELANQARTAAEAGAQTMVDMNVAMRAIEVSSAEVAKIVKNIDEIAFQTNILALNAAVEAARAGEAGQGFAVVADEVRSLAQRSANAARETAEKIEAAIANSRHGSERCGRVGDSLDEIAGKISAADTIVAEIATAAREQTHGIKQIGMAMTQMDGVTRGNAARAEESSNAATELTSQAHMVRETVDVLRSLVGGRRHQQKKPAPRPTLPASRRRGAAAGGPLGASPKPTASAVRIPMPGDGPGRDDDEDRNFQNF